MDDEFLKKSKNLAKIRRYRCRWRSINRHLSERLSFPCDQGIKSGVAVYHRHSPYSPPLSPTTRSRQDLRVPRSLSRRTGEREVSFRSPGGRSRKGSPLEEDRPDPPVPIINLPNRISSASGRLEMVDTRGNVLALSRAPLFLSSLFSFLSSFFLRKHLTALSRVGPESGEIEREAAKRERKVGSGGGRNRAAVSRGMKREGEAKGGSGGRCGKGRSVGGSILFLWRRVAAR